ncbi:heme exporter protein CcmD [Pelagibacterium xiamenense]|uniref:heme exporter protein CcmD n=1 Tax=Pelagibacterium xiamenense TaxID=2901140 RepID=UPI001E46DB5E|nr:heme exporter protein CcmD [Pelagibacterium xiamenense]MCD7058392.1 heme exporter protein CcmD [Pelagibacterium xiamenense]
MIELGAHWEFIVAAYLGTVVVVAALVGWTVYDARRTRGRIVELEAKRPRRRGQ